MGGCASISSGRPKVWGASVGAPKEVYVEESEAGGIPVLIGQLYFILIYFAKIECLFHQNLLNIDMTFYNSKKSKQKVESKIIRPAWKYW